MNLLRFRFASHAWLLLLVASGALFLAGCTTNDPANASSRPWNARQGWETGLPGGMFDRR